MSKLLHQTHPFRDLLPHYQFLWRVWILWFFSPVISPSLTWGQLLLVTHSILSQTCSKVSPGCSGSSQLLPALTWWGPRGFCPAPTWKAQDGEEGPALGEPWALPHTAPPEPFVLEHGGDRAVVQVLGAPHVHPRGGDAARQAQDGQEEAHHLACGGGHGFGALALWPPPSSGGRCGPTVLRRGAALIRWFPSALGVCSQCFP